MMAAFKAVFLAVVMLLGGDHCEASWYARGLPSPDAMTAASRKYPRGSWLLVIHGARFVVVKVNDYGPEAWTGRGLDLSRGAARQLGLLSKGFGTVIIIKIL